MLWNLTDNYPANNFSDQMKEKLRKKDCKIVSMYNERQLISQEKQFFLGRSSCDVSPTI